jgi:peptidoglycan/LPS O-acetylase OafA/YrhL
VATTAAVTRGSSEAPSPAVAPPPGNPRFPLFDSLRGLAVLAVVVYHAFVVTGALNRRGIGDAVAVLGGTGPILFFAISGFLLYRPWVAARAAAAPAPRTLRYARRRALRILPAYWFALTALAVFPGIAGVFSADWWRYYLFLQLYDQDTLGLGIPVAWTLCVEVTFYLGLPLWALALRRVRLGAGPHAWLRGELAALALLGGAGALVQIAAGRQELSQLAAQSLLGQSTWFALGMALAVASVAEPHPERRWRPLRVAIERPTLCWVAAAAAFVALVLVRSQPGGLFGIVVALRTEQPFAKLCADIVLTAVLLTLVLLPATFEGRGGGMPRRVLATAPLALLGLISYGVYLWHLTIAELLGLPSLPPRFQAAGLDLSGRIPNGATPVVLVLTLALSCAVAAASYRFVELPFLRRKER